MCGKGNEIFSSLPNELKTEFLKCVGRGEVKDWTWQSARMCGGWGSAIGVSPLKMGASNCKPGADLRLLLSVYGLTTGGAAAPVLGPGLVHAERLRAWSWAYALSRYTYGFSGDSFPLYAITIYHYVPFFRYVLFIGFCFSFPFSVYSIRCPFTDTFLFPFFSFSSLYSLSPL